MRIGLLAGAGKLPGIWLEEALKAGEEVVAYHISGEEQLGRPNLSRASNVRELSPGNLGELTGRLKKDNIEKIIMLGKLEKSRVFQPEELDQEMQGLLDGLPNLQDETILKALARRLDREGFELLPQNLYLDNIFLDEGWLIEPSAIRDFRGDSSSKDFRRDSHFKDSSGDFSSEEMRQQLERGLKLAKMLSGLEIGQSVMFKAGTVLAVEAVEGSDAAIRRAGELAGTKGSGFFMAKASRPRQDFRLDIPAAGPETLRCLNQAGGQALAVEAGRVLVLEQEKMASLGAEYGIAIYAGGLE